MVRLDFAWIVPIEPMKNRQSFLQNLKLARTSSTLNLGLIALGCDTLHDYVFEANHCGWREDIGQPLHQTLFDDVDSEVIDDEFQRNLKIWLVFEPHKKMGTNLVVCIHAVESLRASIFFHVCFCFTSQGVEEVLGIDVYRTFR